jgi:hypothetical protein
MTEVLENPHVAANNARNLPRAVPSPDPEIRLTLSVKAGSESVLTEFCIAHLRERGYAVTAPNEKWETPSEFNRRLEIGYELIHRTLKRPGCPAVLIEYGPGRGPHNRRILGICSNPAFEAFVLQNKNRPKSTWKRKSRCKPAHELKRSRMRGQVRNFAHQ